MSLSLFAVVGQPLFGSIWLALFAVLGCIAVLMLVVALAGRWLAATHPAPAVRSSPPPAAEPALAPETLAVIAGAVNAVFGAKARVASVSVATTPAPSVEALMLQWSLEGRRQIYTSHKVR